MAELYRSLENQLICKKNLNRQDAKAAKKGALPANTNLGVLGALRFKIFFARRSRALFDKRADCPERVHFLPSAPMAHAALILTPGPDAQPPARAALVAALAERGLIGAPHGAARHAPGPRFAQLMCFLGCSPTLNASDDGRPGYLEVEVTPDPHVILHGIEEGIALPSDELLAALAAIGGGEWSYRYRAGDPPLSR